MEPAHDVTPQVLLVAHGQCRLVDTGRAAAAGRHREGTQAYRGGRCRACGRTTEVSETVVDLDEPLQESCQDSLLALQDLALCVEEQLTASQRQQAVPDLGQLVSVRRAAGFDGVEPLLHLGAPAFVALDLDEDLLHEQIDLSALALDATDVVLELGAQVANAAP